MENADQNEGSGNYSFLSTKEAKSHFAEVDYYLKNGMHIQRDYPKPEAIYRFVDTHSIELKQYYKDLFEVVLNYHGDDWNKYYYLDFNSGTRGNIVPANREYLTLQHTIIGLLFLNVYKIDTHIEINTILLFKRVLQDEYPEYNQDLIRLLAESSGDKETDFTDKKVDAAIEGAFKLFSKLGWIAFIQEEEFNVMPSFERLRKMYENQIQGVQDIFKSEKKDNDLPENT